MAVGFQLHHHQTERARRLCGTTAVSALYVVASHAKNETGTCYPTIRTVARYAGISARRAASAINALVNAGILTRRRRGSIERRRKPGGPSEFTIVRTDGPRGFVTANLDWTKEHAAALGPGGIAAYTAVRALGNGRWTFALALDQVRLAVGVSRSTFFRLLAALQQRGLVRHRFEKAACWWELPELKAHANAHATRAHLAVRKRPKNDTPEKPERPIPVPKTTPKLYKSKILENLHNSGFGFDSMFQELDKTPRQDARVASTLAPPLDARRATLGATRALDDCSTGTETGVDRQDWREEVRRPLNNVLEPKGTAQRAAVSQATTGPRNDDEWIPLIHGATVFNTFIFDVFWLAIESKIKCARDRVHPRLVKRVNGMLRHGGVVARAGLERFEGALDDAICDREDRCPGEMRTGSALLDVIGDAVQRLGSDLDIETGDIGHADGRGCPMAVYAMM